MPIEVLKVSAPVPVPVRPMVMRKLEDIGEGEHLNLGCPMLTRTRIALPSAQGLRAARCSLGWAVHGEEEVVYCLHTPDLLNCWKVHPEQLIKIQAMLEQEAVISENVSAAD